MGCGLDPQTLYEDNGKENGNHRGYRVGMVFGGFWV